MSKLKERRREIQAMDMAGAQEELKTLRRRLFDLRLQKERGEVKDTRQFANVKADIARLVHHISELRHEHEMDAMGELTAEPAGATKGATTGTTKGATKGATAAATAADEDEEA